VFVALGIQYAMLMRRIMLSSVACPAVQDFSTLPYNKDDFRRKLLNMERVLSFFTTLV
jgi:hypothetical protein